MNVTKTALLLAAMTALFMALGFMLGGQSGMLIAFVIAIAMNAFSYWNADKMLLRMHGAVEVNAQSAPTYYRMVERLAKQAGLPMPKVYLIDTDQPNAFATGRDPAHAAVAATKGIMAILSEDELEAVMAHELGHVRNRDTLIMTVTATIAGAIGMLANFAGFFGGGRGEDGERMNPILGIALMILAPLAAMVVQMAISRTREYGADKAAADISGKPLALASALEKISAGAARIPNQAAEANPATAHLFIINPLSGRGVDGLFSTHPNPQNRIDALVAMAKSGATATASRAKGPWG